MLRVPDISVAELRAKYASPTSQFVEVLPGLTVHLRDEGPRGAPVLVLLHGSNASLHTWEPWVARLKDSYRIVSLDLPAHGLTGPDPQRDYSTVKSARIVAAVADHLRLGRFVLAGNSMGGGIAARFAVTYPDRLNGLVLVDAGGQPTPGERDTPLVLRIAQIPVVRDVVAGITPRWLVANGLQGAVSVKSVLTEAAVDRYWELLRYPGNRQATLDRFGQGYGSVSPAELAGVKTPTLILWGREDRFIPVSSAGWYAQHLPNARTVIYDRVGHLPMEETPDVSARDVRAFMASLQPAGRIDAR
ncbi:alpha/beta hydrolase [Glacieibacterium frigidum]|uniref:Alpha/beta hydrolase n=2 Tax=Glacieibacterium frigidum TaxID=2593303 RepID=A0A552UAM4_9SPHN|nr:alpha/beta hydrolase [Glacieibacterium frigidum]